MFELWFYLALLAAATWAFASIIHKVVLTKHVRDPLHLLMFMGIFGLLISLFLFLFRNIGVVFSMATTLSVVEGVLVFIGMFYFFRALQVEEASRVIPMMQIVPLPTLFLATIFLNEYFTLEKYVGMFALVAGGVFISFRKKDGLIKKSEALEMVLLVIGLFAVKNILDKWILMQIPYWTLVAYKFLGFFLASSYLWTKKRIRRGFVSTFRSIKVISLVSLSQVFELGGDLLTILAISMGPVSLVTSLKATEQLFVLIFATILSLWMPHILKEEVSKGILGLKLFSILRIVLGVYLIG